MTDPIVAPRTGIDAVDAVLTSIAELDARPVSEHAPLLEEAHAVLRRTLDDAPVAAPDLD